MNKIRFGIVGTGNIAHRFAEAIKNVPQAELSAVASRSEENAENFCIFLFFTWKINKNSVKYYSITLKEVVVMDKKIQISMLCQIYGKLLTEKQFDYINDYYNNDLSLAELAENYGITRQAARDNIKKGENKLFEYEEKLQIMKTTLNTEKKIANILAQIATIQSGYSDEKIADILENIKNELVQIV